jgi:hypothetical protein
MELLGLGLLIGGILVYFLPSMLAKQDTTAIFVLNLFLGWTLVGWVAALVWALKDAQPEVAGAALLYAPGEAGASRKTTRRAHRGCGGYARHRQLG